MFKRTRVLATLRDVSGKVHCGLDRFVIVQQGGVALHPHNQGASIREVGLCSRSSCAHCMGRSSFACCWSGRGRVLYPARSRSVSCSLGRSVWMITHTN